MFDIKATCSVQMVELLMPSKFENTEQIPFYSVAGQKLGKKWYLPRMFVQETAYSSTVRSSELLPFNHDLMNS